MLLMLQTEWGDLPPMASPGELIETMAEAVGLPRATLVSHDRLLSEAGLRTKAGRGRGAAKVTPRDAALLLTAVLASAEVRDSVRSVRRYAASRLHPDAGQPTDFRRLEIPEMAALPAESSFLDALDRLIEAAANGSLRECLAPKRAEDDSLSTTVPLIEIMAETPGTIGEIRVATNGGTASLIFTLPGQLSARDKESSWAATIVRLRADRDLAQQRRVSAHTLARIGALLADATGLP